MPISLQEKWDQFRSATESFGRELKAIKYTGAFEPQDFSICEWDRPPPGSITLQQAASILSREAVAFPHGFDVLYPPPLPKLPTFPAWPSEPPDLGYRRYYRTFPEKAKKLKSRLAELELQLDHRFREDSTSLEGIRRLSDPQAICRRLMDLTLLRHPLPKVLRGSAEFFPDFAARLFLATIDVPDFARLQVVKKRGKSVQSRWSPVSATDRKRALETVLYGLTIRAAYLIALSDAGDWFDTIAVNTRQHWSDPATGSPRQGIVASLQAMKSELVTLQVDCLDPKACFRHLKGISTPSIEQVAPVRPIFVMDRNDERIVENRDVAEQMEREANLAAMPWEDFEQLVRQLFEWEFGRNGIEVKVTRASRDRGVDAIMFDPDPLRGGKYVLQAKRYTRTVDVAAVRDLYGTVVNEGANRGVLVTTATYGPDAYEFAKNKPISLVDGPNLIAMLKRHGRAFRIDLDEARRLNLE